MKRVSILLSALVIITSGYNLHGQKFMPNSVITGVCYAGKKVNRIYIPPPKEFTEKSKRREAGTVTVYYTGFAADSKVAVEYAAGILAYFLPSDLNLTVKASWAKLSDKGVLGNSRITGFAGGWSIDALEPYAYYPLALAEKISGEKLNEDWEGDIELIINSTTEWYLGTDGKTPVTKYDLVTVVLHELMHGLGFFDSMDTDGSVGWYGISSIPVIYDTFVEDVNDRKLTDQLYYNQYSSELYRALTGGQAYFNGPLSKRYMLSSKIRLYAPSRWDTGSSISHLDEAVTLPGNSLMTPFIDLGEAIHDPGQLTMSMLGDLGWINTRIIHDPPRDTEEHLSSIIIDARISSDTLYNKNKVGLVYSFNDFTNSDTVFMIPGALDGDYSSDILVPSYNTRLSYYIFAEDDFMRLYKLPSLADLAPYTVFIGTDTVKPKISHSPPEYFFENIDSISLESIITDNLGIDTAYIEFRINNGISEYYGFTRGTNNRYSLSINVLHESLKGGDSLRYRIIAVDKASSANIRTAPAAGYYVVGIERLEPVLAQYQTDFSNAEDDFFTIGFEITEIPGFTGKALHSGHPYKSPEEDDKNLEFSAILRHPIVFDASGMVIKFREIVLVEPGEEGSVYGFSDFYDYVIIEGSKNFGKSWFSITDGYDSRKYPAWEEAYNSTVVGINSTYQGEESMFIEYIIYPRIPDRISSGDSILIRFRLFSDPYANGWGWVVDDLKINPLVDNIEDIFYNPVTVYPNPGNGTISIKMADTVNPRSVQYSIYNTSGLCIVNKKIIGGSDMSVQLTGYPSGIYIIVFYLEDSIRTIRYSLIKK